MSHPNPFAFVLTSILLLSACGADNSDVELTENQKGYYAPASRLGEIMKMDR